MLFHDEIEQKGKLLKFSQLPIEAKKSIIQYMCVEGDNDDWSPLIGDDILEDDIDWERAISAVTAKHGDREYTYYEMPRETFAELIMQMPSDFAGWYDTFEEYHQWYAGGGDMPEHGSEKRWPALAWDDDEGLVDGWHRTHAYYKAGHKTLPFIL